MLTLNGRDVAFYHPQSLLESGCHRNIDGLITASSERLVPTCHVIDQGKMETEFTSIGRNQKLAFSMGDVTHDWSRYVSYSQWATH